MATRFWALSRGRVCSALVQIRSGALQPPMAFDVVGNGREMDPQSCLDKPDPSQRAKMVSCVSRFRRFSRSVSRALRPRHEWAAADGCALRAFRPTASDGPCAQKPCGSTLGFNRLLDRKRIMGFVGITSGLSGMIEGAIATSGSLAGVVSMSRMMRCPWRPQCGPCSHARAPACGA
jgi:hypothetical protein